MYGLWGLGLMNLTKTIIVVDDFVNVQDPSEVTWRVANNINPSQDIVIVEGPLDDLEVGSPTPKFGGKVGIDATRKGPLEGYTRGWPPDIEMSPDVKTLVDSKWKEYGFS